MTRKLPINLGAPSALLAFCAVAAVAPNAFAQTQPLIVESAAVAADHELASAIGAEIMRQGGNAADAAVAVGLALGVTNPFASGIGGGAFLLYRDAASNEVYVLDFRETAPAASTADMYVVDGTVNSELAIRGGLAVAVPGEVAGWVALHERFGTLPWETVVEPARALAADGFPVGSLLADRLIGSAETLLTYPDLAERFRANDEWLAEGDWITRPALAQTLAAIQDEGGAGFYTGAVAEDIVATVQSQGGILTSEDLAAYEVRWLDPIVTEYRGYEVFGMPPPSSGGIAVAETLAVLEHADLSRMQLGDPGVVHLITETLSHVFADRAQFLGDPDYFDVPVERLLGDERTQEIRDAFNPVHTLDVADYGMPTDADDDDGTSHFSIVDPFGNAVACTSTINRSFGSMVVADGSGVLLNDEMDDFSAQPGVPNGYGLVGSVANAIEPGKRPLSSMSPTIVTQGDRLVGALGGSGGPMIITSTLLTLLQMMDWDANAAEALAAPRFHHQWLPFTLFMEETGPDSWSDLTEFGHEVVSRGMGSAVQLIWEHEDGWQAASDPRKHGVPSGF